MASTPFSCLFPAAFQFWEAAMFLTLGSGLGETTVFQTFRLARLAVGMSILLAMTAFRPPVVDQLVEDLREWPCLQQQLQTEQRRTEILDHANLRLRQRILHKEHLVALLIEGECSLAQVTEEFWQSMQSDPGYLTVLRHHYPGSNDYEKTLANVLHHVQFQVQQLPPAEQARVWKRLEAERQQLVLGRYAWEH
jgi:hypothetical protein